MRKSHLLAHCEKLGEGPGNAAMKDERGGFDGLDARGKLVVGNAKVN